MRRYFVFAFIILATILSTSCGNNIDQKKFIDTYAEVLIIRETVTDSLQANKAIQEMLAKRGYTEQRFKEHFIELAKNQETFFKSIDSVRSMVIAKYKIKK